MTSENGRRFINKDALLKRSGKKAVHSRDRVAHSHRVPGVAVITLADRREVRASLSTLGQLILNGKLHGHFDGNGTGVGVENLRELLG